MADLHMPVGDGDIRLARAVPDAEHADDYALLATERRDTQYNVTYFEGWDSRKGLTASVPKSAAMVFEAIPTRDDLAENPFIMYGNPIQWVHRYKYIHWCDFLQYPSRYFHHLL